MPSNAAGFYYHTETFEAETFAEKCANRLEGFPTEIDDVAVRKKQPVDPEDFFGSNLTDGWETANYGEHSMEFDVAYSKLNEKSRQREIEHLSDGYGQFFVMVLDIQSTDGQYRCSALIEIRGRAQGGKTEFFIRELIEGGPGL